MRRSFDIRGVTQALRKIPRRLLFEFVLIGMPVQAVPIYGFVIRQNPLVMIPRLLSVNIVGGYLVRVNVPVRSQRADAFVHIGHVVVAVGNAGVVYCDRRLLLVTYQE